MKNLKVKIKMKELNDKHLEINICKSKYKNSKFLYNNKIQR